MQKYVKILIFTVISTSYTHAEAYNKFGFLKQVVQTSKDIDACNQNNGDSCLNLAFLSDKGKDFCKANEYYLKACAFGAGKGCYNLGYSFILGRCVNQDVVIAKEYFMKACSLDVQRGCDVYKEL